jgi:hypothetical protein
MRRHLPRRTAIDLKRGPCQHPRRAPRAHNRPLIAPSSADAVARHVLRSVWCRGEKISRTPVMDSLQKIARQRYRGVVRR